MSNRWLYYLHENGDVIGKNPIVLSDPEYFDSPFVRRVWDIDTTNRADFWNLVLDLEQLGARKERIRELIKKWNLDLTDAKEFTKRTGKQVEMIDGLWRRTG
jgi:hypothetical protein